MGRKKVIKKAKDPVKLRYKELADGNLSIYLDIYHDGKRKYEFLKLHLVPEDGSEYKRKQNEETRRVAEAIKAKRMEEVIKGVGGLTVSHKEEKHLLVDVVSEYQQVKEHAATLKGNSDSWSKQIGIMCQHLEKFMNERKMKDVCVEDVNDKFCNQFINYLRCARDLNKHHDKPLSEITAQGYQTCFSGCLEYACKEYKLGANPMNLDSVVKIEAEAGERVYLTSEELKQLVDTPIKGSEQKQDIRNQFLFACYTGLRWSDISQLRWEDIKDDVITTRQQKTQKKVSIPLSKAALEYLPGRSINDKDLVFNCSVHSFTTRTLKEWAEAAGIKDKNVTFHVARHTFATLLVGKGADIYTVSKLLGHKRVTTTQIYADVLDKAKESAVSMLDNLF